MIYTSTNIFHMWLNVLCAHDCDLIPKKVHYGCIFNVFTEGRCSL